MAIPPEKAAQGAFAERLLEMMQNGAEPLLLAESAKPHQPYNFMPNVTLMLGAMMLHKGVRTCVAFARD